MPGVMEASIGFPGLIRLTTACRRSWEDFLQRRRNGITEEMRLELYAMQNVISRLVSEEPETLEISVDTWKKALEATDSEVEDWLKGLLRERGIEPTPKAMEFISSYISLWLDYQIAERGYDFPDDIKGTLRKLFARIAYDFHRVRA